MTRAATDPAGPRTRPRAAADRGQHRSNRPPGHAIGPEWCVTATIKTLLAGATAYAPPLKDTRPYANICEHCPSLHVDTENIDGRGVSSAIPQRFSPVTSPAEGGTARPNAT
jgi:hypothetical protein